MTKPTGRPIGRPPGKPKTPEPVIVPETPADVPLLEQIEAEYNRLRKTNSTIRKWENELERQKMNVRNAQHQCLIARTALRQQERWLKKRAAEIIRKRSGIKVIAGAQNHQGNVTVFRDDARAKEKQAEEGFARALTPTSPTPPNPS